MVNKETVHLIATIFWGLFGLAVGIISTFRNDFNVYVMVSLISAIAGNSVHLISMSFSKTGISVSSENPPKT
jgi:hypothetical protein